MCVCAPYLRQYQSGNDYLIKSRMKYVDVWATEVEIEAMANHLGLNIHTFTGGRWLSYRCMDSRYIFEEL